MTAYEEDGEEEGTTSLDQLLSKFTFHDEELEE